jgi:hypothetical protein
MHDIFLEELSTTMTNVGIHLRPTSSNYANLDLELYFEEGNIIIEMHDLEVVGSGLIKDPDNGNIEVINFSGPITTGNIVIHPEEELHQDGEMYPRFSVVEVNIKLDQTNVIASAHG